MRASKPQSISNLPHDLQAVVFDLGGVLTTGPAEALALALSKHQSLPTPRLKGGKAHWNSLYLRASLGEISADELWRELLVGEGSASLSAETAEAEFLAAFALREPDIAQTLHALQVHYRLGLLSNHVGRWARALLDRFDLCPFFEVMVISSEIGARKPDALPYQLVCQMLSIEPQQAAYVADEEEDLIGCQAVGLFPIFIAGEDDSSRVGWVIQRLSDLLGLVQHSRECAGALYE